MASRSGGIHTRQIRYGIYRHLKSYSILICLRVATFSVISHAAHLIQSPNVVNLVICIIYINFILQELFSSTVICIMSS